MSMFTLRRSQKQSGFTLMELLIVIAVLGLLLGLIAPRMGGITTDTADNVCDTNNKGIRYYTQMFMNQSGSYPNYLTNLVDYTTSNDTAVVPSIQDDTNDGAEVLAWSFVERNYPGAWALSTEEVEELRDMGITVVHHLIGNDGTSARPMYKDGLSNGTYVLMVGFENASEEGNTADLVELSSTTSASHGPSSAVTFATGSVGNPEWFARIMMAVNDQCELVTGGMIQASALCPTAVLNETKFSHKEFTLILPRLEATVARFASDAVYDDVDPNTIVTAAAEGAVNLAKLLNSSAESSEVTFVDASDEDTGALRTVSFEAQESWQFDVSCPEGHKWPADDEENWKVYSTAE